MPLKNRFEKGLTPYAVSWQFFATVSEMTGQRAELQGESSALYG
jgi:hypothetical protein